MACRVFSNLKELDFAEIVIMEIIRTQKGNKNILQIYV